MTELYLIAQVAGRAVAIESDQVESVVDIGEVTAVPRATSHIRGLAALRSRVVTVVDTPAVLGLESSCGTQQRAVITVLDGHHYALLVDALEDVAPFEKQAILTGGPALDASWRAAGTGIIERDGEPILAIDLHRLVPGHAPANLSAH
ncbi:chemotaxis protein CheW [Stakelama tenebrarum]|uniref:Chemotaxis protein CheW n=1 Tax=Stakelama tenebrarum TaxID=2711215 RepID=A0A6G6Y6N9_9SPHN|nr:chemotaxis protein CheW [Sphingosinithalassobacter tenebrarum]QIG80246.1 chemotaxis protein CheW [Sphingosinithalassobacter tenebrarum]